MEDDTWSATIMGRGDERSPREADEILWEARTKWRRYTLHQTEYAISSANLLFSYISIAGRLLMPTRPATPLGLLNFIVIRRFVVRINEIRCETRVPSLLVLVNARGRPLKMKITERGISSRISPTNPRYRCSLIFRPLSLFPRSRIVRSSRSRIVFERVLHTVVLYISLGKCFAGIICRGGWKEGIRVTKFIPVFPPSARNTVLYIYLVKWRDQDACF